MTMRGHLAAASLVLMGLFLATPTDAATLHYLAGRLDEDELAELKELAPNVEFLVGLSAEQALARAPEIDAADAHVLTPEFLAAAKNLRWVQAWSAGVNSYLEIEGLRNSDQIVLTNMQGVHGPAIAEHVMATLLALTRKLPQLHAAQREGRWNPDLAAGSTTLAGRTLFVVGMGGIGSQVARRAHAFDMTILATVRHPNKKDKASDTPEVTIILSSESVVTFLTRFSLSTIASLNSVNPSDLPYPLCGPFIASTYACFMKSGVS